VRLRKIRTKKLSQRGVSDVTLLALVLKHRSRVFEPRPHSSLSGCEEFGEVNGRGVLA